MDTTTVPQMIISFILLAILGGMTAYFAERRGRSPGIWFFVGMMLGFLGLLLLFILPSYGQGEIREAPKEKQEEPMFPPVPQQQEEKLWFYLDKGRQQHGPVPSSKIRILLGQDELTASSYVWSPGMDTWKRIGEIGEL